MRSKFGAVVCVLAVAAVGCAGKPSPMEVCEKLQAAGEVSGCVEQAPTGLGAAAKSGTKGDLPSLAGKTCQVMSFGDEASFTQVVAAYEGAAALAGPHRYNNKAKLVFVQCNSGLDTAHGAKVKAVVDGL